MDTETQEKLNSVFAKHLGIEKVILYGSRAKGNFKNGSDIDLTLFAPLLSLKNLLQIENEIDDLFLPYKVDLSLYHFIDHLQLQEHINRVGLLFYKK
ncbi:MAG: nucleotidyltransferase domain-containing protein [Pseudobdellovibrionaceae bacterium]